MKKNIVLIIILFFSSACVINSRSEYMLSIVISIKKTANIYAASPYLSAVNQLKIGSPIINRIHMGRVDIIRFNLNT